MKDKKIYSLRALRKEKGLTIQEVAEQMGVAQSTIHLFETSPVLRRNYSPALKNRLAIFYHVPVRLLFPEISELIDELAGKKIQVQMFLPVEKVKKD